jgi:hypothetical protein
MILYATIWGGMTVDMGERGQGEYDYANGGVGDVMLSSRVWK